MSERKRQKEPFILPLHPPFPSQRTGIQQGYDPVTKRSITWHRDVNAARNMALLFLAILNDGIVPVPFRRSTDAADVPASQRWDRRETVDAKGRRRFHRKKSAPLPRTTAAAAKGSSTTTSA